MTDLDTIRIIVAVATLIGVAAWVAGGIIERNRARLKRGAVIAKQSNRRLEKQPNS